MLKKILMRLFRRKEKPVEKIDYVDQTEIPMLINELIIEAMLCGEKKYLGRYFDEDRDHLYNTENKIRQILCKLYRGSLEIEKIDELLRHNIRERFYMYGYHHGYYFGNEKDSKDPMAWRKGTASIKELYDSVNEFISRLCKLESNWKDLLNDDDNIYCIRNGVVVLAEKTPDGDLIPKERNKGKVPVRKARKKKTKTDWQKDTGKFLTSRNKTTKRLRG